MTLGLPGPWLFSISTASNPTFYLVARRGRAVLRDHQPAGEFALSGRAMVALKEERKSPGGIRRYRRHPLSGARRRGLPPASPGPQAAFYAHYLNKSSTPMCSCFLLHRHNGDHGDYRRQGHAGGPDCRRPDLWVHSGGGAVVRLSGTAMESSYGLFMILIVFVLAAGHRARDREMVSGVGEEIRGPRR